MKNALVMERPGNTNFVMHTLIKVVFIKNFFLCIHCMSRGTINV